jgi:hypothetical protein
LKTSEEKTLKKSEFEEKENNCFAPVQVWFRCWDKSDLVAALLSFIGTNFCFNGYSNYTYGFTTDIHLAIENSR